ncbi:MAG: hypothetical protein BWY80_01222 [Firmicutes bacterium ADurb.Bin456]|nr:MAG: hypothetical protein BWY80_01222 [Firmicutes bacterium ADurb.Bin456]
MVLNGCGNNMVTFFAVGVSGTFDCQMVGFSAAAGKNHFFLFRAYTSSYLGSRPIDSFFSLPSEGMDAGGVAEIAGYVTKHFFGYIRVNGRCSAVIKIYFTHQTLLSRSARLYSPQIPWDTPV